MTTVYGVTRYGATQQILKKLKDMDIDVDMDKRSAAAYLSKKTFESLQEMFQSSKQIQVRFCLIATTSEQGFLYVTVNMCNQGIRVYCKALRVCAYSLNFEGTCVFPGFDEQGIHIFPN